MITFPNAKINIGLTITGKRTDGFHNLHSVFYPIALKDALEIIPFSELQFTCTGFDAGNDMDNLCIRAYTLLQQKYQLPPVKMHVHKGIPAGSGLGGGSSDAAFTLKLLNTKFNIGLSDTELSTYASELGSDCPFFLQNRPCQASGRGEILEPIDLDLSQYSILIIHPGIHINTAEAFSEIEKCIPCPEYTITALPIENWKGIVVNDFEKIVGKKHPKIPEIINTLYHHGALYASMSGSGGAVYGIFSNKAELPEFPERYFLKWI